MNVSSDVNYEELARSTDDFNGAQLKAVCVEAVSVHTYMCGDMVNEKFCSKGMIALRRGATELIHEDYMEGKASMATGGSLCVSCVCSQK